MVRLRSPAPYGGIPEWPKGADCKSVSFAFGGPNPPSPTKNKTPTFWSVFLFLFDVGKKVDSEARAHGVCRAKICRWHIFRAWTCTVFALSDRTRAQTERFGVFRFVYPSRRLGISPNTANVCLPCLYIITRQRAFSLRLDDIQPYGLMIYRNELRMIYKATP